LNVGDNWTAYWQAVDTQFQNEHKVLEGSQKMQDLGYKGHISNYLVTLKDHIQHVNASGQTF
jgi:Leu/Phe-tRNA-protein transferase